MKFNFDFSISIRLLAVSQVKLGFTVFWESYTDFQFDIELRVISLFLAYEPL